MFVTIYHFDVVYYPYQQYKYRTLFYICKINVELFSIKFMRTIERFDKYMKVKKLNDNKVTNLLSLSVGTLGKSRKPGRDLSDRNIEKILNYFQDLNKVWLLTGEGEMFISNNNASSGAVVIHNGSIEGIANNIGGHNNTSTVNDSDLLIEIQRLKEENSNLKDKIIELQQLLINK